MLRDLEELTLISDSDFTLTKEGLRNVAYNISRSFRTLKRLKLDYGVGLDIGEKKLLTEQTYQSLEQLHLFLQEPQLRLKSQFIALKQLVLMHDCRKTTDEDFQRLITSVFNCSLNGLQELVLIFDFCPLISSKGFEIFQSGTWTHLENLETLKLEFSECHKIDSFERVFFL